MSIFRKLFSNSGSKFHDLFEEGGRNLDTMAKLLSEMLGAPGFSNLSPGAKKMYALESANDHVTHRLLTELGKNFITPFDREDIHTLSNTLDDIADYMLAVVEVICNYHIDRLDNISVGIAQGLQQTVASVNEALKALRDKTKLDKLDAHCYEIRKLTSKLDNTVDGAIVTLFAEEKDPVRVIKMMEYYDVMQILINKCADVADVMESIVIKYS